MSLHNMLDFPHIAVMDPRTQRLLWSHTGSIRKEALAEKLSEIGTTFSYDDTSAPPPLFVRPPVSSNNQLLEDEALAMALSASLEEQKKREKQEVVEIDDKDDDEQDEEVQVIEKEPKRRKTGQSCSSTAAPSGSSQTVYEVDEDMDERDKGEEPLSLSSFERVELLPEPEAGVDGVTKVMIRSVEGKRLARRFLLHDPVSHLYKYAQGQVPEAKAGKKFDLCISFPAKSLLEAMNEGKTIQETSLANASVMMTWVEED